jgi:hypothetical protein
MKGKWFYFAGYWTGKSAVRIAKGVEPIEVRVLFLKIKYNLLGYKVVQKE